MTKPIIGLHGGCVATCLVDVLGHMPSICRDFDVEPVTTFNRDRMPLEKIARCVVHIVQNRVKGYSFPLPDVAEHIRTDAALLVLPNLIFSSLWPLSCVDPRDVPDAMHPLGRHPPTQTDRVALDIMRTVPDRRTWRSTYLAVDLSAHVDLDRYHEVQAAQMKANDHGCHIQVGEYILASFRKQRLFFAAHHPSPALILHLVGQLLNHPLFAPFRVAPLDSLLLEAADYLDRARPFHGEEVPIHPQVARHFELEWWSKDLVFHIDGGAFTFEQWIEHYMADPLPGARGE